MSLPQKWQSLLNAAFWLGGLIALYLVLKYVAPYFTPFLVALALAVLIDPTVDGLEERLHLPRGWATAVALLFFLALVVGLVLFAVGAVVVQLGELSIDLPAQYDRLVAFAEGLLARAGAAFYGLPPDLTAVVESTVRSSLQSVYVGLKALVEAILNGLKGLPAAFLMAVISLVATFFFSRDKDLIAEFVTSLLPPAWRERVARVNRDVVGSAVGLVKAQLVLVGITLVLTVAGLYVLGVHYAWLVGFLCGVLDVLPAVGPATILLPWSVYCLIDRNFGLGIGLVVLLAVITAFRQIMEPRIIGQRLGLHPLLTLLSLYLGFRLLGAAGIVVGPLVAIVVKAVVRSGRTPPPRRTARRRARAPTGADPADQAAER